MSNNTGLDGWRYVWYEWSENQNTWKTGIRIVEIERKRENIFEIEN